MAKKLSTRAQGRHNKTFSFCLICARKVRSLPRHNRRHSKLHSKFTPVK